MLPAIIIKSLPPIASLAIVMTGCGLLSTLLPIKLHLIHSSSLTTSFIYTAYAIGLIVGSYKSKRFIISIGHIRAYTVFASVLAASILAFPFFNSISFWLLLRAIGGICTAGIYIVIESWLLAFASVKKRGTMLSLYMITFYGAQSLGMILLEYLDPRHIYVFCIISIFIILSNIPVAASKASSTEVSEHSAFNLKDLYKKSPSGVIGCFSSGMFSGAIMALLPFFGMEQGLAIADIAQLMALTILGGMVLQYPVGRISDIIDRQRILIVVQSITLVCAATIFLIPLNKLSFMGLTFLFGGFSFTLYPLSINHACDYVPTKDLVGATQGLLFSNSLGSICGPIIAGACMHIFAPVALFVFFSVLGLIMLTFFSMHQRHARKSKTKKFTAVPQTTLASNISPTKKDS